MSQIPTALSANAQAHWNSLAPLCEQYPRLNQHRERILRLFALSDFAAELCLAHPQWLEQLVRSDDSQPDYANLMLVSSDNQASEAQMLTRLRLARQQYMLHILWRDLCDGQSITDSLKAVSELSDALILRAYRWAYQYLCRRYGVPGGDEQPMPMTIIAMGKLGGRELNFSSDIDLIFLYPCPGEIATSKGAIEHQTFFTKLAQRLIGLLDKVTADGRVFRVDMRLRPYGESGPLVCHYDAFEHYLQQQGRPWERYAMVKARILNPDGAYGEQLKGLIRPFVYRRYLDFGAIESLRRMKSLIQQEYRRKHLEANIKLGRGGIREVEFVVQSLQLIHGGKKPQLQTQSLLKALATSDREGLLTSGVATGLKRAYLFLRKVEHCLQQFGDQQTQELPTDAEGWARLCWAMGLGSETELRQVLDAHRRYVSQEFGMLIGNGDEPAEEGGLYTALWCLDLGRDELEAVLGDNVDEAERVQQQIRHLWRQAERKLAGARGKEVLDSLVPALIAYLIDEHDAQVDVPIATAMERVFAVISAILGRTAYLELLLENAGARAQLVKLTSVSPWLSEQISRFPMLLDELLDPVTLYQVPGHQDYAQGLRETLARIPEEDVEQQLEGMRQFKLTSMLRIAAADVSGVLPISEVSNHLTWLAEALIAQSVRLAWQQTIGRFGCPPDLDSQQTGFGVIAYGKAGGMELGYGSDLDLVFVFEGELEQKTDGHRPAELPRFYLKLAQKTLHHLTVKTGLGQLYEVDMRLRPSGNAGLLVCHMDGYQRYLEQDAWLWEFQALARARMVLGSGALTQRFNQLRLKMLMAERSTDELNQAIAGMREKMRANQEVLREGLFHLKQGRGGITDIEFIIQYWLLQCRDARVLAWSDNLRQIDGLVSHQHIDKQTGERLQAIYLNLRERQHHNILQGKDSWVALSAVEHDVSWVRRLWEDLFNRPD